MSEIKWEKCKNGHQYDPAEHQECPYCPRTVGGEVESRKRAAKPVVASPSATVVEGAQGGSHETPAVSGPAPGGARPAGGDHTAVETGSAGREAGGTVVEDPSASTTRQDRVPPDTVADTPSPRGSERGGAEGGRFTRVVGVDDVKLMPIFAWLAVLEGAQQYMDFRIDQEQVYLGGSAECDIVLEDDFISGEHASLRYREGKFFITDLDSRNGTFVNDFSADARIDRVQLHDGDSIRIGKALMKFKCL